MKEVKEDSAMKILWGWAKPYHGKFIISIVLATLGVVCQMLPYFSAVDIATKMINK